MTDAWGMWEVYLAFADTVGDVRYFLSKSSCMKPILKSRLFVQLLRAIYNASGHFGLFAVTGCRQGGLMVARNLVGGLAATHCVDDWNVNNNASSHRHSRVHYFSESQVSVCCTWTDNQIIDWSDTQRDRRYRRTDRSNTPVGDLACDR